MKPIVIPIHTRQRNRISVAEVRLELRKIEEIIFGTHLNDETITQLNIYLESRINLPYNLDIRADIANGVLKLYGYTSESKEVLDPNFKKEFISKIR